ncbi:MAG: hypothetical protein ACI4KR_10270 [Ruminiclostridium sp.]
MNKIDRNRDKNELLKAVKREKTRNYVILYTTVLLIWIALTIFSFVNNFFSGKEFVVNIVNNLIGILPPILIFDFFNEKLTRDASAVEMSTKITETLMSNPETLDLFTEEQRKDFIISAVTSIVKDPEAVEMVTDNLKNYLNSNLCYRIRTSFDYNFELDDDLPAVFDNILTDKMNYFYVQEKLHYKVKYLSGDVNNTASEIIKLGFIFDNINLDSALREKSEGDVFENCIFRESLDIKPEDLESLKNFIASKEAFQSIFKVDLQIDSFKAVLDSVTVYNEGIVCAFRSGHDVTASEHSVRIIFHMPKIWDSLIEVALVDPVKAPKISVSYPEDIMDVDMYSFLSKGKESSLEVAHEHFNGIYDIAITSEWIYPISGMVFKVNRK